MTYTLFPDMEREIREERTASSRERVQHARNYLRDRDISWLINRLLDGGPKTECELLLDSIESGNEAGLLFDLIALWRTRKLWRKSMGIHPGAGVESFLFGIRNVHQRPL